MIISYRANRIDTGERYMAYHQIGGNLPDNEDDCVAYIEDSLYHNATNRLNSVKENIHLEYSILYKAEGKE